MSSDRFKPILDGVKEGAVKQAIDKVVDSVATPAIDKILESLNLDRDGSAGKMSESAIKFIIMLGLAEGIGALGPSLGGAIGGDEASAKEKSELLSMYMKKYAGEKIGADAVGAAIELLPQIAGSLWQIDTGDLKLALGESKEERIPSLFEEEVVEKKS